MDNRREISYELSLDTQKFEQGIATAQQLVNRMGAEQSEQPTPQAMPPGMGAPPPPPPSKEERQGTTPDPIGLARQELERIRNVAEVAPDVAQLQLQGGSGRGGLRQQILKGAATAQTPEEQQAYQELLKSLKDLSHNVGQQVKQSEKGQDPASSVLNLLRNDMMIRTGGGIANQFMQGDLVGGTTSTLGAGIGMLAGGPAGAAAGAQLGQMLGGILAPFFGGMTESEQRMLERNDIAARFADPTVAAGLTAESLNERNRSGYSLQETTQLFDQLRQQRLITGVDDDSKELVESMQGLSRALGENTQVLSTSYSEYRRRGGEEDFEGFMNGQLGGAIAAGMRQHLSEYMELTASSSRQLVSQSMDADDGGGMRAIQNTLSGLLGDNSRYAGLMRDNPGMAQQMMSGLLATGTTNDPFGQQSVMMRAAGVDPANMLAGFATPEETVQNAIAQQQYIFQRFTSAAGIDPANLQAQAQANPDYVRDELLGSESSQILLNTLIEQQFGSANAENRGLTAQMMQLAIENGGNLNAAMVTPEGETVQQLLEGPKSDAELLRESVESFEGTMAELGDLFQPAFSAIREELPELLEALALGIEEFVTEIGPELSQAWDEIKPILDQLLPVLSDISVGIGMFTGNAAASPLGAVGDAAIARNISQTATEGDVGGAMGQAIAAARREARGVGEERANRTTGDRITDAATDAAGSLLTRFIPGLGQAQQALDIGAGVSRWNRNRTARRNAEGIEEAIAPMPMPNLLGDSRRDGSPTRRNAEGIEEAIAPMPMPNLMGGNRRDAAIDAAFNDTPFTGVDATESFNTFQFAPGDRVFARRGGESQGMGAIAPIINLTQHFEGRAEPELVADAARRGVGDGMDDFVQRWRARQTDPLRFDTTDY